ncbi:hypothetical protein [Luteibacter sp. CQ10]|uniref:hypothetical protein n=1 Tax=Luteibacter sp. CQ10 TaxID=2805821 RepID=UPI0034A4020D
MRALAAIACGALCLTLARRKKNVAALGANNRLRQATALLATSVLTDSAMEHYRGSYANPAMVLPPAAATLALAASATSGSEPSHWRSSIFAAVAATGMLGTGFHLYNITKRPGGWSWQNLFYAAPVGAPGALMLAGLLGVSAEAMHRRPSSGLGRMVALLSATGMAGTCAEVALLHFRGAFQHRAMYLPVTIAPLTTVALLHAGVANHPTWLARWGLRTTALLGMAGSAFHIRGVARNHGGWRNWSQNLFNGPPVPAPPGLTALSIAGLAALDVLDQSP